MAQQLFLGQNIVQTILANKYKSSLNGINFEWTAGQITKKGFEGWFVELVEYQKQNGTVEVLGDNNKKNPQLAKWGNYARRTAIAVLTNKKTMQNLLCNDVRCLSTLGCFLSIFIIMDQTTVTQWAYNKIAPDKM
jgi:hypothetical protein